MTAKQHYSIRKTKQKSRDHYNKYMRERSAKMRALLNESKNKPCMDCGNNFPPYCMDYDHVRGEKVFHIGASTTSSRSWETIQSEIEKCDLVCANCHRTRTHYRTGFVPRMAQGETDGQTNK